MQFFSVFDQKNDSWSNNAKIDLDCLQPKILQILLKVIKGRFIAQIFEPIVTRRALRDPIFAVRYSLKVYQRSNAIHNLHSKS